MKVCCRNCEFYFFNRYLYLPECYSPEVQKVYFDPIDGWKNRLGDPYVENIGGLCPYYKRKKTFWQKLGLRKGKKNG